MLSGMSQRRETSCNKPLSDPPDDLVPAHMALRALVELNDDPHVPVVNSTGVYVPDRGLVKIKQESRRTQEDFTLQDDVSNVEEVAGLHLPELYEDTGSDTCSVTPILSGRCSAAGSIFAGSTHTLENLQEEHSSVTSTDSSSELPEADLESFSEVITLTSDLTMKKKKTCEQECNCPPCLTRNLNEIFGVMLPKIIYCPSHTVPYRQYLCYL
jgi:hypothetical protein